MLAVRSSGLDHAVAVEEHAIAGLQVLGGDLPHVTTEAHGQRGCARELADEVLVVYQERRRVPRVDAQLAVSSINRPM